MADAQFGAKLFNSIFVTTSVLQMIYYYYLKSNHILTACTELHSRLVSKYRSARFSSSLNLESACKQRHANT